MATTVLDQLITVLGFKADTKDLDKINQKIKNIQGSINKVAKGFAIAGAALTGVGVAVGEGQPVLRGGHQSICAPSLT